MDVRPQLEELPAPSLSVNPAAPQRPRVLSDTSDDPLTSTSTAPSSLDSAHTSQMAPPLLFNRDLTPQQIQYARSWYGPEVETEGSTLAFLFKGRIPAADYRRWWQVNQFVCSGKTQTGHDAAFGRKYKHWQREVDVSRPGWDAEPVGPLQDLLVDCKMPIKQALRRAVDLAVDIRAFQTLRDGNHRSALLSMILSLAEASVMLRPNFPIIRLYTVLSARHHKGNNDNALEPSAIIEVRHRLFQVMRHAVAPGTPTWDYIDKCANEIRDLPILLSRVESMYCDLQLRRGVGGGKCSDRDEQQWAWRMLEESDRALIKLVHPSITHEMYLDVKMKYY